MLIQIVKYDGINTFKDEVVDYCFEVAILLMLSHAKSP